MRLFYCGNDDLENAGITLNFPDILSTDAPDSCSLFETSHAACSLHGCDSKMERTPRLYFVVFEFNFKNCLVIYFSICNLFFPPDWTLVENQGKIFFLRACASLLFFAPNLTCMTHRLLGLSAIIQIFFSSSECFFPGLCDACATRLMMMTTACTCSGGPKKICDIPAWKWQQFCWCVSCLCIFLNDCRVAPCLCCFTICGNLCVCVCICLSITI